MSIFSYRKHLRFLSQAQRRRWWDQKKRLTPRVVISGAYVPPNVSPRICLCESGLNAASFNALMRRCPADSPGKPRWTLVPRGFFEAHL